MQVWTILLAAGAAAGAVESVRRVRRSGLTEAVLNLLALAGGGLKLWLARGQPLYAVPAAPWDDRLFLQLTGHLLDGRWLGPYDRLTFAKGPFYPLFMAGAALLKLPLLTAHNLVYLAACWLFVRALRPLGLPGWTRALLLLALIFCPTLADSWSFVRAWRQSLWPGLVLLSLAGTVGLALRAEVAVRRQVGWAVLAGVASGAMWLTREEGAWTLPMLALPLLVAAGRQLSRSAILLLPLGVAALGVALVAAENYRVYRFWGIVEFHDDAFVSAYSALCRVQPGDPQRRIPVTRAAREKIYAVSPAFASLRGDIETGIGTAFMKVTQDYTGIPAAEHEIGGGWMMWTLREAVNDTGQAKSAPEARAFYRRLANEVNAACDDGRLAALPRRHSMMPPWHNFYWAGTVAGAWVCLQDILRYPFIVDPVPSEGTPEDVRWVERLTHERATPPDAAATAALVRPHRLAFLHASVAAYGLLMPWCFSLAGVAWLFSLLRAASRRELRWLPVVATALLLGLAGNIAVVALINATSWPSINLGYLGASPALSIAFAAVMLAELAALGAGPPSRPPPA